MSQQRPVRGSRGVKGCSEVIRSGHLCTVQHHRTTPAAFSKAFLKEMQVFAIQQCKSYSAHVVCVTVVDTPCRAVPQLNLCCSAGFALALMQTASAVVVMFYMFKSHKCVVKVRYSLHRLGRRLSSADRQRKTPVSLRHTHTHTLCFLF